MTAYTEDTLVQQTTADYLEQQLGWQSIFAYNNEDFGPNSLLGRASDHEVVLTRILRRKLAELNPGPARRRLRRRSAADHSHRGLANPGAPPTGRSTPRCGTGVMVTFRNGKDERVRQRLRLFDFDEPTNNHFLCVRELWVQGNLYRRRSDIVGFVNGLPLLFIECKNIHRSLKTAFERNFSDYLDTIPHLFHHNAVVMFGNGEKAKIGSITSRWEHFHEWKRLDEKEPWCRGHGDAAKRHLRQTKLHGPAGELHPLRRVQRRAQEDPRPQPPIPWRQPGHQSGY